MVEVIPATQAHLEAFYGKALSRSVYAIAGIEDGKVIGLAGVYREPYRFVMFSEITPELKRRPKAIIKGFRMLQDVVRRRDIPVHAQPDAAEPGAVRFLEHLGFNEFVQGVYEWRA